MAGEAKVPTHARRSAALIDSTLAVSMSEPLDSPSADIDDRFTVEFSAPAALTDCTAPFVARCVSFWAAASV